MSLSKITLTQKQREFIYTLLYDDSITQIGYGGARSGGKTYVSCLGMCLRRIMLPNTKGLMVRKTQRASVENLVSEIKKVLYEVIGLPKDSIRYFVKDYKFVFPNGSEIVLSFCGEISDYEKHQGIQYCDICFEEGTQHLEAAWLMVIASNRHPGVRTVRWITCNPGGDGHEWVKRRFVNEHTRDARTRFISATIYDNPAAIENMPGYITNTLSLLDETTRKMWIHGNWDAISGSYFEVMPFNVIPTCQSQFVKNEGEISIPYWSAWVGGVDDGSTSPFCVLYAAKWTDEKQQDHLHVVKELYRGGLHIDERAQLAQEYADNITVHPQWKKILYYADPAINKKRDVEKGDTGSTVRQVWAQNGFYVLSAHTNARAIGWQLVKYLLKKKVLTIDPSCYSLLSQLRLATYDGSPGPARSEDIQLEEDHALDALRYMCVSVFNMSVIKP